ncbi:2-phospho-L-lactate guanylyltransferase [soil metagenome]
MIIEVGYAVIVPVKPPAVAKSRLGGLGDGVRRDLAAAFAADTVASALMAVHVAMVLAVTDDHRLAGQLVDIGAQVLPDGVADDLNQTLVLAAAEVGRRAPGLRLAALCADLPAMRPEDLGRALTAAPGDRMGFVSDLEQIGTTLLTAPGLERFRPGFGEASRAVHLSRGAHEIQVGDAPGLRRDVDTPADLVAALLLGTGPRTTLLAADLS